MQHETLLEEEARLSALTRQEQKELARLTEFGPAEPKPYSFLLLEKLCNELADEEERQSAIKTETKAARQLLASKHEELDAAEQRHRGSSTDKTISQVAAQKSGSSQSRDALAVTVAAAAVNLAETAVELQSLRLELSQARRKRLQEESDLVKKDVRFSADDRDRELERLTALAVELDQQRTDETARWHEAAAQSRESSSSNSPARSDDLVTPRDVNSAHLLLIDQERELLASLRKLWKRRYDFYRGDASETQVVQWLEEVDECASELKDWQHTWEQRLAALSRAKLATHSEAGGQAADEAWEKFRSEDMQHLWNAFHAGQHEVRFRPALVGTFSRRTQVAAQGSDAAARDSALAGVGLGL